LPPGFKFSKGTGRPRKQWKMKAVAPPFFFFKTGLFPSTGFLILPFSLFTFFQQLDLEFLFYLGRGRIFLFFVCHGPTPTLRCLISAYSSDDQLSAINPPLSPSTLLTLRFLLPLSLFPVPLPFLFPILPVPSCTQQAEVFRLWPHFPPPQPSRLLPSGPPPLPFFKHLSDGEELRFLHAPSETRLSSSLFVLFFFPSPRRPD